MTVSLVIPTLLTQTDLLQDCIFSLRKQKVSFAFDVWVVANTPDKELKAFQQAVSSGSLDIHWLSQGRNTGFTGAVNAGIEASAGDLVILLNDDTTVNPDWLEQLVSTYKKSKADMVASTIYLSDKKTLDSQGFTFLWRGKALPLPQAVEPPDNWKNYPDLFPSTSVLKEPFGPDAAAALYTRELLIELGGFNNSFFAYLEDVDLALRARKAGYTCALAEKAVVYHHKHATSSRLDGFKARQDFMNWWRIVLGSYPRKACLQFGPLILLERAKNLSGLIKSIL